MSGTPVGTRTPNLLIRNQTLYPIELRVLSRAVSTNSEPPKVEGNSERILSNGK
jgi:hypothetical protein